MAAMPAFKAEVVPVDSACGRCQPESGPAQQGDHGRDRGRPPVEKQGSADGEHGAEQEQAQDRRQADGGEHAVGFGLPIPHRDQLESQVNVASRPMPAAQWFERLEDGAVERIEAMAGGMEEVAALPEPIG